DGPLLWNLQVSSSGSVSGVAISALLPPCPITGTASGNTLTLTSCEGRAGTGTVQGGTVTGTFMGGSGLVNGVFAGSTSACTAPTSSTPPTPGSPTAPKTYVGAFSGSWMPRNTSTGGVNPTPV